MLGAVTQRARNCPACRQLNAAHETRCFRCDARLPTESELKLKQSFYSILGTNFPVTKLLVAQAVIIFAIAVVQAGVFPFWSAGGGDAANRWDLELLKLGALPVGIGEVIWPTLLSAVFVHFSVLHVGMNSWVAISFGRHLESLVGGSRLALIFVITGIAGFLLTVAWVGVFGSPGWYPTAGMSGAVFGLGGAYVGVLKGQGSPHWKQALGQLVGYVVLMAVIFWGGRGGVGVNNAAHIGGLAAGFGLGVFFSAELRRRWKRERLFFWLGVGAIALSVASVAGAYVFPSRFVQYQEWKYVKGLR